MMVTGKKTIGNPAEGFNYVTFMVNGTPVVNPAAPVGFGYNRAVNFAEVPERNFSWHELKKTESWSDTYPLFV